MALTEEQKRYRAAKRQYQAGILSEFASTAFAASVDWQASQMKQELMEHNEAQLRQAAEEARKEGKRVAAGLSKKRSQVIGAQKAAMAAQGIDVSGVGTISDIISDTVRKAGEETINATRAAALKAHGFEVQAIEKSLDISDEKKARSQRAVSTIIGGLSTLQSQYRTSDFYEGGNLAGGQG